MYPHTWSLPIRRTLTVRLTRSASDCYQTLIGMAHHVVLPSQVHPSYPYGNPFNIQHPAARPRRPYDPSSRALFEDMGFSGGGVNGSLRWKDLALDTLYPIDEARQEAERAAQARKMASGASTNQPPPQPPPAQVQQPVEDDEDEENDENEDNGEEDDGEVASSEDDD